QGDGRGDHGRPRGRVLPVAATPVRHGLPDPRRRRARDHHHPPRPVRRRPRRDGRRRRGLISPVAEYRASFDAAITFGNGGDLTAHGFRVDVPSPDVGEAEIAALFVASLGLLMTDTVRLDHLEIFAEPHKGTRGGPSDRGIGGPPPGPGGRLVELNHVIRAGMITYPGLP